MWKGYCYYTDKLASSAAAGLSKEEKQLFSFLAQMFLDLFNEQVNKAKAKEQRKKREEGQEDA